MIPDYYFIRMKCNFGKTAASVSILLLGIKGGLSKSLIVFPHVLLPLCYNHLSFTVKMRGAGQAEFYLSRSRFGSGRKVLS